jgi:hypothetical protein
VRRKEALVQPDAGNPLPDQSGVTLRCYGSVPAATTAEEELARRLLALAINCQQRVPSQHQTADRRHPDSPIESAYAPGRVLKKCRFWRVLASAMIGIAVADAFCGGSNWAWAEQQYTV